VENCHEQKDLQVLQVRLRISLFVLLLRLLSEHSRHPFDERHYRNANLDLHLLLVFRLRTVALFGYKQLLALFRHIETTLVKGLGCVHLKRIEWLRHTIFRALSDAPTSVTTGPDLDPLGAWSQNDQKVYKKLYNQLSSVSQSRPSPPWHPSPCTSRQTPPSRWSSGTRRRPLPRSCKKVQFGGPRSAAEERRRRGPGKAPGRNINSITLNH